MNREPLLQEEEIKELFQTLHKLHHTLGQGFQKSFNRSLPFTDEVFDRWERAKELGFGEGTSVYDSSYVFGDVTVGKNTWIGPFTIIDGSGGLVIGHHCTVAAGVHIYTHDNVHQTLTGGKAHIQRTPVTIGDRTYIGPQSIITKGVSIGDHCIIGAGSLVTKSLPPFSVAYGTPAKVMGTVVVVEDSVQINYF